MSKLINATNQAIQKIATGCGLRFGGQYVKDDRHSYTPGTLLFLDYGEIIELIYWQRPLDDYVIVNTTFRDDADTVKLENELRQAIVLLLSRNGVSQSNVTVAVR